MPIPPDLVGPLLVDPGAVIPGSVDAWSVLSRLGEAQILLPLQIFAALLLGFVGRQGRLALAWVGLTALAASITTIDKLAYHGFGVGGVVSLDYMALSGHAMFSASIYPMLAWLALPWLKRHWSLLIGLALAVVIAISRVKIGAHSWAEVIGGGVLGAMVAPLAFRLAPPVERVSLRVAGWRAVMPVMAAGWLGVMAAHAAPSQTHTWVMATAERLSGRLQVYDREDLRRRDPALFGSHVDAPD